MKYISISIINKLIIMIFHIKINIVDIKFNNNRNNTYRNVNNRLVKLL